MCCTKYKWITPKLLLLQCSVFYWTLFDSLLYTYSDLQCQYRLPKNSAKFQRRGWRGEIKILSSGFCGGCCSFQFLLTLSWHPVLLDLIHMTPSKDLHCSSSLFWHLIRRWDAVTKGLYLERQTAFVDRGSWIIQWLGYSFVLNLSLTVSSYVMAFMSPTHLVFLFLFLPILSCSSFVLHF